MDLNTILVDFEAGYEARHSRMPKLVRRRSGAGVLGQRAACACLANLIMPTCKQLNHFYNTASSQCMIAF
jgi:hypothetical protein